MQPIRIDIDEAYKIKVEKDTEFETSFFYNIYERAQDAVNEICNNTNSSDDKLEEELYSRNEYSNIIAFMGERGTGKTSVMISFLQSLDQEKFEKLNVIDPSLFSGNESIFEVIIGSMFNEFQKKYQEVSENEGNDVNANELLEEFQTVYRNIRVLKNNRKELFNEDIDETIIETLSKLASGVTMKSSFESLVKKYIEYFKKSYKEKFLVIPIDDLDMNIEYSPVMIEEIRKYLKVNHVIVLMAIKMEQMSSLIEQMYIRNFNTVINSNKFIEDPKEMAARYMEKLLPEGRKFRLPSVKVLPDEAGRDIEVYKKKYQKDPILKGKLEDVVLSLTYDKTGLIFVKNTDETHYLIPDNLRELHDYISVFYKLPNDAKDTGLGLQVFEKYFMTTWIDNNLPLPYIKFLNEFYQVSTTLKNKYLVTKIGSLIKSQISAAKYDDSNRQNEKDDNYKVKKSDFLVKIDELKQIIYKGNKSENISLGDVLLVLNTYNEYYNDTNIKKLVFAIKTIYSINFEKRVFDVNYQRKDNLKHIRTLLGGRIFNYKERKFLPSNRDYVKLSYSKLEIDGININEYVKKIANYFNKNEYRFPLNTFNSVEYLNLFILNFNDVNEKTYRSEDTIYYDAIPRFEGFENVGVSKYAYFDILAFSFNLIDTDRYLKIIFDGLADDKKCFSELISQSIFNHTDYREWYRKYRVILPIYSIELLEKIFKNVENKIKSKLKNKMNKDWFKFIKAFVTSISDVMNELIENDKEYYKCIIADKNFVEAFTKCPIIRVLVENNYVLGKESYYDKKIEVGKIFNAIQNAINTNINNELISELTINRSKFKKYSAQRQIPGVGFKGVVSRFIIWCDNKDDFSDDIIDRLRELRMTLDDDSSQKTLKDTSDEIVEIIDREVKRLKNEQ